jgi:hypothetical protein
MNRGAGRPITTAAGFTTTITGRGVRAADFNETEVGGGLRWSRLTSPTATTFAGIHCHITSVTHARAGIVTMNAGPDTGRPVADEMIDPTMPGTKDRGAVLRESIEETLAIRSGERRLSMMNGLRGE